MSRWKPCKRRIFIRKLRGLGFEGPFSGTKHLFMILSNHRLAIPSNEDYSISQVRFMLKEVESIFDKKVPLEKWDSL